MVSVTDADIEALIEEHGLTGCFDCGKCTACCPMSKLFADLTFARTPRGIIEKALISADLVTGDAIWYCLTCDVCTDGCPSGVQFRDFISALRELAIKAGQTAYQVRCRQCSRYFMPHRAWRLVIEKLSNEKESSPPEFLTLCPGCRSRDISSRFRMALPGHKIIQSEE